MRKKIPLNFVLVLIFFIGLSLLLYPSFSNYWNSRHQTQVINSYSETLSTVDTSTYDHIWAEAHAYNQALVDNDRRFYPTPEEHTRYNDALNLAGDGVMGYIEIPSIKCELPIYHGTAATVLQFAAGHIEGSSLPVGGPSTHSLISAHRGLPSAKLFTDLDKLQPGDLFMFQILSETLTYEVDQILIVEPQEVNALGIEEGADYCTLVTCTPYGINSHRLLVRGHRVENALAASTVRITANAVQIEPLIVAPVVAAPLLLSLLILVLLQDSQNTKNRKKKSHGGDSSDKTQP